MRRLVCILAAVAVWMTGVSSIQAAPNDAYPLAQIEVDNSMAARQRGAVIAIETCMMCHGFKYLRYQDLLDIGMSAEDVDNYRGDNGLLDRLESMTPIEVRKESYGKVPPDLTLMTIARKHGPEYVYTLLTSYYLDPEENEANHLFPGIRMPDAMGYSFTEPGSTERAEVERNVSDLVSFMVWASDPNAETRKTIGVWVILYLIVLTTLLYLVKRKIWRRVEKLKIENGTVKRP